MGKRNLSTLRGLTKKLDEVFSQYIRRFNSTSDGQAVCVTCHAVKPWKELQCGHYESRRHLAIRWDERNAHVQCYGCNIGRNGNYPAYSRFMLRKYGAGILDELERLTRQVTKNTRADLEEKIAHYKARLSILDKLCPGCTDPTCKTSGCIGA
jgi:hypothetical protein